ncbi:MAG: SDR family oxidoreductase [Acidimicrobiia bacterium]|nr:SDR family oxidoreductase [Acidimicrobiia bacterium]
MASAPGVLSGKVAIVTGAGGGYGESYSRCLAEVGASVVMSDLHAEHLEAAAARLTADGLDVIATAADVTDRDQVHAMVRAGVDAFGGVDILVNNAGLMAEIPMDIPLAELSLDWWDRVLRVNLTGPFLCIQAVVPEMKKRGAGRIVNQSSGGAFGPSGVYGVSKLGLVSLTVTMAHELARFKITVNAIAPGFTNTEAALRALPAGMESVLDQLAPLKGQGSPEDVHGALLLLTTPAGDWITGQTLNVDGGWVMRI